MEKKLALIVSLGQNCACIAFVTAYINKINVMLEYILVLIIFWDWTEFPGKK